MSQLTSDLRTEKKESNASIDRPPRVPAGYRSTNHASIRVRARLHLCNSSPVQLDPGRVVAAERLRGLSNMDTRIGGADALGDCRGLFVRDVDFRRDGRHVEGIRLPRPRVCRLVPGRPDCGNAALYGRGWQLR